MVEKEAERERTVRIDREFHRRPTAASAPLAHLAQEAAFEQTVRDVGDGLIRQAGLPSLEAVEGAFGADVDYAQLVKMYGASPDGTKGRYSPAECTGIRKTKVEGNPDMKHVSTSYVERSNLTMRMQMRRFTRPTNAFSKKAENHLHALALYFMFYNFGRIHKTLRVSPAMAAGVSDKLWSWEEIAEMVDAHHVRPTTKRGSYKKRKAAE